MSPRVPGAQWLTCRRCGAKHNGATSTDELRRNLPEREELCAGAFVICVDCGALSVTTDDLALRAPTSDEWDLVTSSGDLLQAMLAVRRRLEGRRG